MTGMPIIEVLTNPHHFRTAATHQFPNASPSTPTSGPATQTYPTIPVPSGPVTVAQPLPSYPYICTVSEPVRGGKGYLPPDGMCDYLFFDSLYKNLNSSLLNGINFMEFDPQYVIHEAARYSSTQFGLSFSPENGLFKDYTQKGFLKTIDEIWNKNVSNFGFLNIYRHFTQPGIFAHALTVLKVLYKHLEPSFVTGRRSYYVIGMTPDSTANHQIIDLMKILFTPSLFIAVSHLSYPVRSFSDCLIFPVAMEALPPNLTRGRDYTYGHSVNESLALLRQVEKAGLSIPLGISFSLKGVYYTPKFASPSSPKTDEFQMFKPCQDHRDPYYEDPKLLCSQGNWTPKKPLPVLAYNMVEKKTMTYLTEAAIAQLACDGKQFNLNLKFALAVYDVDFDYAPPCFRLGFQPRRIFFDVDVLLHDRYFLRRLHPLLIGHRLSGYEWFHSPPDPGETGYGAYRASCDFHRGYTEYSAYRARCDFHRGYTEHGASRASSEATYGYYTFDYTYNDSQTTPDDHSYDYENIDYHSACNYLPHDPQYAHYDTLDSQKNDSNNNNTCGHKNTKKRGTTGIPGPSGQPNVAQRMPSSAYVCTVSQPVRGGTHYLPPDGMCDVIFYDSLYKNGKSKLLDGVRKMEQDARYFIQEAYKYYKTKFGISFAAEPALLSKDYKSHRFNRAIDKLWNMQVHHFGFLDLYRQYTNHGVVTEVLTLLRTVHVHLMSRVSVRKPSYYVVGMSLDSSDNSKILGLMKSLFTPSMFISIAHLSYSVRKFADCLIFPVAMALLPPGLQRGTDYSYGHTVNESVAVLHEMDKMGFSIPFAISFSLKGAYYAPKLDDPSAPEAHEFQLFKPCEDFKTAYYDDPKTLCGKSGWKPENLVPTPELAYNLDEKRAMTYLPEKMIATLACEPKQFYLNISYGLAAYDVDYDQAAPCRQLGFALMGTSYTRVRNMRALMEFLKNSYTHPTTNFVCQTLFDALDRFG
ncbi:hypothetical protein MTO96_019506 [Rhipicephalus appendiculatus]